MSKSNSNKIMLCGGKGQHFNVKLSDSIFSWLVFLLSTLIWYEKQIFLSILCEKFKEFRNCKETKKIRIYFFSKIFIFSLGLKKFSVPLIRWEIIILYCKLLKELMWVKHKGSLKNQEIKLKIFSSLNKKALFGIFGAP